MRHTSVVAAFLALFLPLSAAGHGGGLDRNGCHTNRQTGEYHCHRGPAPTQAPAYVPESSATPPTQRVSAPVVRAAATNSERDLVRAAQTLLRALGYKPSLLGSLDERTQAAVRAFQRAENLEADGTVTEYLVLRLAEKLSTKCE